MTAIRNYNRENAVKQISKALARVDNHDPDAVGDRLQAAIANAYIYIGDQLQRIADSFDDAEVELPLPASDDIAGEEGSD